MELISLVKGTEMPDEKPVGPQGSPFGFDSLLKIANLLVILGAVFTWSQKTTSTGDFTASEVTQLRSDLKDQSAQMREMQVNFAKLQQQVANLVETMQQDQRYRSATQK